MNKRGFTLTELLAVIVIISILSIGAISGYTTMSKNSRKRSYESKVSEIENAALKYAKENNITTSSTISVNKLVVQGYLQPDEATDQGLASVINPQNNENMICNLVNISIHDDIYLAEYYSDKKNCEIAEQDLADLKINIKVYPLSGTTIDRDEGKELLKNNSVSDWTKEDVVLLVSSTEYTDVASISYDYDGKTITKNKNTPISDNVYNEEDFNKLAIDDVEVMFNSEVTVTYNMEDGSTHSRTVTIRIDKEPPTLRTRVNNDFKKSAANGKIFLDDGNGSGVKGYYIAYEHEDLFTTGLKTGGIENDFTANNGDYQLSAEDNVGNRSPITYETISNIAEGDLYCEISLYKNGTNEEVPLVSNEWYNSPLDVVMKSNATLESGGASYYFGTNENGSLTKIVKAGESIQDTLSEVSETSGAHYYGKMANLGKDEYTCELSVKIDLTAPTATFTPNTNSTFSQNHKVKIEITDNLSGFSSNEVEYQWSTSDTSPTGTWESTTGTLSADNKKITITELNDNTIGTDKMTGAYYLWLRGTSIKDLAGNGNDLKSGVFNFDNIAPTVSDVTASSRATGYNTNSADLTVTGSDTGGSNLSKICIKLTDGSSDCTWEDITSDNKYTNRSTGKTYANGGSVTFYVWFKDGAGNISESKTATYDVYKSCSVSDNIINNGNATCGTDYGTCTDACGGKKYASLTQKKKDKYTGGSCTSAVTPNSTSCSAKCGGKAAETCDSTWKTSTCSDICGGTTYKYKNCRTKSSDGTKICSTRVYKKPNSSETCGGKEKSCGNYGACDSNNKKRRTCRYVAISNKNHKCGNDFTETTSCCNETNWQSCQTKKICDSTCVWLHKQSGHIGYGEGDISACTGDGDSDIVYLLDNANWTKVHYKGGTYYIWHACYNDTGGDSCYGACVG